MASAPRKNLLVDILKTTDNRRQKTVSVYRKILSEIESKVRRRLEEGGTGLIYDFPVVRPGLPTYDVEGCVAYVTRKLHGRGLDTERTGPRQIAVSWKRLLKQAKRQKTERIMEEHRRRKEARARRKRAIRESMEAKRAGPPVPPHADEPGDLFSLPSVRGVRDLADALRKI